MPAFHPRASLATHEVTNQPMPLGAVSLFADPALNEAVQNAFARLKGADMGALEGQNAHLQSFGQSAGSLEAREQGRLADENPPKLRAFNGQGMRIDEIEFHPAWHDLMALGLEGGVASRAWTHSSGGHITHGALMAMMTFADGGVCCPMSMTYAVTSVLKNEPWADKEWTPRVTMAAYDPRVLPAAQKTAATMGMAMTEKQGGSDLRANSTRASSLAKSSHNDEVELSGHKWFCSAPMCDAFLTLAYEEAGLSCFLVPRWRPDGSRNALEIQRLKDKLGDHSNASSEIEYRGAWARRIGPPGRGIPTIIIMAHHTRYDCITGSAGAMRKAVLMAANFVRQRTAFQKKLIDQPLMRNVLADLALESEAALALAFRVGASFDAAADNAHEAALSRVLTPIAKYWICKRQPALTAEALECFGGIGYVEETGMARLFRAAPLNAIWEGSGNVIALDIQRAMASEKVAGAFADETGRIGTDQPSLRPLTDWLLAAKDENPRLFAERAALVFAADALAAGPLREAFIATRLLAPSHIWGASSARIDRDLLLSRTQIAQ